MPELPEILSPKQVKDLLKVSLPTVYRMAEKRVLPCIRWGTGTKQTLRFKQSDVFDFIEQNYTG